MHEKPLEALWKEMEAEILPPDMPPTVRAGIRDFFFFGADACFQLLLVNAPDPKNTKNKKDFIKAERLSLDLVKRVADEIEEFFNEDATAAIAAANDKRHEKH